VLLVSSPREFPSPLICQTIADNTRQYIHLYWGPGNGSLQETPDVYLAEAIAAARRGVQVRILLSDAFLDPKDPRDNSHTVEYVNQLARQERLDMQARIVKSRLAGIDKIHNKGVVVDSRKVLISSVNWSQNSPANNRETSLLLEHPTVGAYYTDIFTGVTKDTRTPDVVR
jgi:cardiolipin synthase A/B